MNNSKFQKLRAGASLIVGMVLVLFTGCDREDGELVPATFPATSEVFTDTFTAGIDYLAYGESKLEAFDIDTDVAKVGTQSMRFEVPDADDPDGSFAGGILATVTGTNEEGDKIVGGGRDLTGYNVLSFWAKSSSPASIGVAGFGNGFDGGGTAHVAGISNISVNANWKKIYVPIPDPSALTQEAGLFEIAAGSVDGKGYSLWIDEVIYENLSGLATRQAIFNDGEEEVVVGFTDQTINLSGLGVLFNLPNGQDVIVNASSDYFTFSSSNTAVANVSGTTATIASAGSAVISAELGGLETIGSLTVQSQGAFNFAPTPTKAEVDVISLFSDVYTDEAFTFFNGFWEPYQTTESSEFDVNEDNIISYTNFNFVGNQFPVINASAMTHLHLDVFIPGTVPAGAQLKITIKDFGADGADGGGDDSTQEFTVTAGSLNSNNWASIDIPLNATRSNFGQLIYENNGSSLSSFYLDNLYFYK